MREKKIITCLLLYKILKMFLFRNIIENDVKGEIIEKSLKVYFAANPHFLWKHFVFGDFGITRGISKWCKHNLLDLSIFV